VSGARTGLGRVALGGIVLLALEALVLKSGSSLAIMGAGVIGVIAVMTIARVRFPSAGIGSVLIAAFTLPWNGVLFGGIRPGDGFILIALVCFVAADVHGHVPRMPWWVNQLTLMIIIIGALHVLIPTDPGYLANRIVVAANGQPTIQFQTNLGVAFKFVVAVGAIPVAFCYAVQYDKRAIRWVPIAFFLGTGLSGVIAFVDRLGLSHLGQTITGNVYPLTRQGGLSNHPNFLAASCILAMPMALWAATQKDQRTRNLGIIGAVAVTLGDYATGSRGGAVCLVLGALATFILVPAYRRQAVNIALALGVLGATAFAIVPGVGQAILKATRLGGGSSADTAGSNAVRAIVGAQGIRDFKFSPLDGIGLQVADQAQNVYIQQLASGGVMLFGALLLYTLGTLRLSISLSRYYDLASALVACTIASTVFNYLEADLTDRFFYVPPAIAVMLAAHFGQTHELPPEDDAATIEERTFRERLRRNLDHALRIRTVHPSQLPTEAL